LYFPPEFEVEFKYFTKIVRGSDQI